MKKNQNGVTLIALAVTIIVMLILAGATMSMLTGNSGIMTNAKKSSAASEEADAYEKMAQAFSTVQLSVESEAALNGGYDASEAAECRGQPPDEGDAAGSLRATGPVLCGLRLRLSAGECRRPAGGQAQCRL